MQASCNVPILSSFPSRIIFAVPLPTFILLRFGTSFLTTFCSTVPHLWHNSPCPSGLCFVYAVIVNRWEQIWQKSILPGWTTGERFLWENEARPYFEGPTSSPSEGEKSSSERPLFFFFLLALAFFLVCVISIATDWFADSSACAIKSSMTASSSTLGFSSSVTIGKSGATGSVVGWWICAAGPFCPPLARPKVRISWALMPRLWMSAPYCMYVGRPSKTLSRQN